MCDFTQKKHTAVAFLFVALNKMTRKVQKQGKLSLQEKKEQNVTTRVSNRYTHTHTRLRTFNEKKCRKVIIIIIII